MFSPPTIEPFFRGAPVLDRTPHGLRPQRLPQWALDQAHDDRLTIAARQPAGVRLVFRTAATAVELDVLATKLVYTGTPPRPRGRYDLLLDGQLAGSAGADQGATITIDMATGDATHRQGSVDTLRFDGLPGCPKNVQIWLPHNEITEIAAIRADAAIEPAGPSDGPVWLHHGSSISHGSNADGPSATWPALAALATGADLTNLGFSGNAVVDPFVARVLRDSPADVISLKLGINVVGGDVMRLRAFGPAVHGFLDTVREGHPDTPLLVVSPIHCPIHEDTPGPGSFDREALRAGRVRFVATGDPAERAAGKLTLRVIRDELARIVEERRRTDPALLHLDGLELYGEADAAELPLPDDLHPDTAAHRRIAERFTRLVFGDGGPFHRPGTGNSPS